MAETNLPTNIVDGQAGHAVIHNETNGRVNSVAVELNQLATTVSGKLGLAEAPGWGLRPTLYYNGTTWPARTLPAGYTGPVVWDSATHADAGAPGGAVDGDLWHKLEAA